jgi:general secretion pathway protein K
VLKKINEKGIALLLAMFCVMIMAFLAVELSFDTSVEYVLSNKEYHRTKAYEAAKAGMELSLLRIQLFKNISSQYGEQLKGQEGIIQMIWSMPFTWPPSVPDDTGMVDKDMIKGAVGSSFMDAHYVAQITAEGSKIDINDLDSLSESLRKATREQLVKIFTQKLENEDDPWTKKNKNFDYENLINNLQDWVDENSVSLNGGDEKSRYPDADKDAQIPPNRPFLTMDELKMVDGVTEEVFQMLLPQVTVYGTKGISVNQANKDILKSIDQIITDEVADLIIERRSNPLKGGPFRDEKDLMGYIGANDQTFNPSKIPLLFGNEYNFRVKVTGEYQNVTREIIAIVYDVDAVRDQMISILDKDKADKAAAAGGGTGDSGTGGAGGAGGTGGAGDAKTQKPPPSLVRPRVVYWWEN